MAGLIDMHKELWSALIRRDDETVSRLVASNCRISLPGARIKGIDELHVYFDRYLQGFPDTQIRVAQAIEKDEILAIRSTLFGTHRGFMKTPAGAIPPSDNPVEWETMEWMTIRDGKIREWRVYQDPTPFMQALNSHQAKAKSIVPEQVACMVMGIEVVVD